MRTLFFENKKIQCRDHETVLEAFIRQGITVPFSCRNGTCFTCMLKSTKGGIPREANSRLNPYLSELGYFLPCKCRPIEDMAIELPKVSEVVKTAFVYKKEYFTEDICRISLETSTPLEYRSGQFINILHSSNTPRSYSLSSVPELDYYLDIQIKRMPGGLVSNWLMDEVKEGDLINFYGPHGNCYYQPDNKEKNILLVATGTGISPLVGIVRDAINKGHEGQIFLYHGAKSKENLYLHDSLMELDNKYNNLHYTGCLSQEIDYPEISPGRVNNIAFANHEVLDGWAVYLCGHSDMVHTGEEMAIRYGASVSNIYSDAFLYRDKRKVDRGDAIISPVENSMEFVEEGSDYPDPELWGALGNGELLSKILDEFYTIVYEDEQLSPFFHGVTKQRAIEKQYSFLRQVISGEKVYFGDRPRNAHHWMVISDELFDYRENIMRDCLRKNGLAENCIKRWMKMEETYRKQIVKTRPWRKIVNGIRYPLDGLDDIVMTIGSMCDGCEKEILPGDKVKYHVRLGTIYCSDCQGIEQNNA